MKNRSYSLLSILFILVFSSSLCGQALSPKNLKYIKKNAKNIEVDSGYINGNWKSVLESVKDKRLVLLGELNHGSKENFIIRNDLIRFLHEKAGFEVILFEAGFGEVYTVDVYKNKLSAKVLTYSLMAQWQTEEFLNLFTYIKSNNLSVGGFDIQRGFGGFFDKTLDEECRKNNIDSALYKDLENQFVLLKKQLVNRNTTYESISPKANTLITKYQKIQTFLKDKNPGEIISTNLLFTLKTIENRIGYLKYMLSFTEDRDWNKRWAARDFGMADNIKWLLQNVYGNKKVIIVAHNFHISKHNENEEVMGEYLKRDFDSEMYSIGTFIGSGSYWEGGKEKELSPVDSERLDIKHIIQTLDGHVHFMNIPTKTSNRDKWMDKKIIVNDSFLDLGRGNELILSKWFDGLLFIDKSTIPEKSN